MARSGYYRANFQAVKLSLDSLAAHNQESRQLSTIEIVLHIHLFFWDIYLDTNTSYILVLHM